MTDSPPPAPTIPGQRVAYIEDEILALEWSMWDGNLSTEAYWQAFERLQELMRVQLGESP